MPGRAPNRAVCRPLIAEASEAIPGWGSKASPASTGEKCHTSCKYSDSRKSSP
jgi:hypothetical protein